MRDNLKDKDHFDKLIESKYNLISKASEKLDANLIKIDRIKAVKKNLCHHYNLIFRAKYSRGDDFFSEKVLNDYDTVTRLMSEYSQTERANILSYIFKKEVIFLNQYILSVHLNIIDLLSLGILLNASNFNLIVGIIDKDNVKDFIYEFLIRGKIESRSPIKEENFKVFSWYKERFARIKDIINIDDKQIAQNELRTFLEKDWYESLQDTSLYNQHKGKNSQYVGYWCYLAAAIVKIKGLDDSSFRDNQYYPKDLV